MINIFKFQSVILRTDVILTEVSFNIIYLCVVIQCLFFILKTPFCCNGLKM